MLGGLAVRERTCPACTDVVRDRGARWCGTCGALLTPPADGTSPARTARRGRVVVGVVGGVALVAAVVTGGGLVDRKQVGPTAVADLAVASPDENALERVARRRPPPPPTVSEPTCTQVREHRCFLWVVEAADAGFDAVTVTDGLVLTEEASDGSLVARDLDDGTTVWSADLEPGRPSGHTLPVTDELVVHAVRDELRARDLATGHERWRTDALGSVAPHAVELVGDVLLVTGEARRGLDGTGPHSVFAAALGAADGELRWREEARSASVAAGGTVVLGTDDGRLRAIAADGTERWVVDGVIDTRAGGGAWAAGHVISVYDERHGSRSYRLADGAPLDLQGHVLTADDDHSFVETYDEVDDSGFEHRGVFALVDADGEVWRVDGAPWGACLRSVRLERTTVDLVSCGGLRISLDRGDGTERSRQPPTAGDTSVDGHGGELLGAYDFVHETTLEGYTGDLVVTDRRTDTEVARLPAESHQLSRHGPWWEPDLGGVTVLQSRGWLVALRLPPPPGAHAAPSAVR